jgi:hypothetical protein
MVRFASGSEVKQAPCELSVGLDKTLRQLALVPRAQSLFGHTDHPGDLVLLHADGGGYHNHMAGLVRRLVLRAQSKAFC